MTAAIIIMVMIIICLAIFLGRSRAKAAMLQERLRALEYHLASRN